VHDWPPYPPVYWATLGVSLVPVCVDYAAPPKLVSGEARLWFTDETFWLPCDVFAAVARWGDPPTRDEFRKLCDGQRTAEGILAALGAEGVSPLAARGVGSRWGLAMVSMVVVIALVALLVRKRRVAGSAR
jgi:hypothetical protein